MARTPAISLDSPFHGSYFAEGSAYQYHAAIPGSDDHQVKEMTAGAVTDGTVIEGVFQEDALDGESVKVVFFGPTWAFSVGSLTRNDPVAAVYSATAAENGRFDTLDAAALGSGKMIAGIALEDTGAAGEKFKLFLTRHIQHITA